MIVRPWPECFLMCSEFTAWKRLVRDPLPKHERISLITMIFSDHNQIRTVMHLSRDDAQTFIDKIDEVSRSLTPKQGTSRLWFKPPHFVN